jgi:hypothetical protein
MADVPPYTWIRDELHAGRVIPFLGAGASFGPRNPGKIPWRQQKPDQTWEMSYLPTASELAQCFSDEANFPKDESRELTKVTQYFSTVIGRTPLQRRLHEIFSFAQAPGKLHEYLAEAAAAHPLLIVTTNYDDLVERAFDKVNRPYDTVVHVTRQSSASVLWQPHGGAPQQVLAKKLDIDISKTSVIYKIHGAIDRAAGQPNAHYVITEDDYVDFLATMTRGVAIPSIFAKPFQERPFLFLGYGLYDWNLRVVLNKIDRELRRPGDIQSWAVEAQVKSLEKSLWIKRNVTVYDNLAIDDFVESLRNPPKKVGT